MLGIGVVGLGRAAAALLPSLLAHPGAELVAVADVNPDVAATAGADLHVPHFSEVAALCELGAVDAVYVATPHEFHCTNVLEALSAGKHVLVEKPMALELADCDKMVDAAAAANVALVVGHTNGFDPPVLAIRRLVEAGSFGAVRLISMSNYTDFLYRPRRPEELVTEKGGGIMFNQFPHQVDVARTIEPSPIARIVANCGRWDPARPTEGAVSAMITFDRGSTASIIYSGYAHFDTRRLFQGLDRAPEFPLRTSSRAALAGLSSAEEADRRAKSGYLAQRGGIIKGAQETAEHERFGMLVVSLDHADVVPSRTGLTCYTDDGVEQVDVPSGSGGGRRATVIDELVAAAAGETIVHDGTFARETLAVCLAALESSQQGREIKHREQS